MGTPKDTLKPPAISDELIQWLDRLFPNECPKLTDEEKVVWFHAGQANVVSRLKVEQKRQREGAT
jgi:hypothetical protein